MADSAVNVLGTGTFPVDTRTESTNSQHRQVVVVGDPSSNSAVAAVKDASTLPVATDPALVVVVRPDTVNANGQATMANSAPVVIASNQSAISVIPTGNVAHDAADTGNPSKAGGRARSSEITPVANDDRSDFITDLVGKHIVLPYANPENFVSGAITTAMTGTSDTSLLPSPGAGLRNYITQITVSNSHATVGTDINIKDGSTTIYVIPAAAVYGGAVLTFPTPLRQPTTATAINAANVTTGSSTKVSASGYKGA